MATASIGSGTSTSFVGPVRPGKASIGGKTSTTTGPPTRAEAQRESDIRQGTLKIGTGGGGGTDSTIEKLNLAAEKNARALAAAAAAARKAAEQRARQQRIQKAAQEKAVRQEKRRIENFKKKLDSQNSTRRIRNVTNAAGDKIKNSVIINPKTKERILIQQNLTTGEKRTRVFEKVKGSKLFESGGITEFIEEEKVDPKVKKRTEILKKQLKDINKKIRELSKKNTLRSRDEIKALRNKKKVVEKKIQTGIKSGFITKEQKAKFKPATLVKGIARKEQSKRLRGKGSFKGEAALIGLGAASAVTETIEGVIQAPAFVKQLIKTPGVIKKLPSAILKTGVDIVEFTKVNPSFALGRVGGEIFVFKGTGAGFKVAGKLSKSATSKLKNVRFTKLKGIKAVMNPSSKAVGSPVLRVKSVAQIRKEARRSAIKKAKQLKKDTVDLSKLESRATTERIDDLTERLANRWETVNEVRLETTQRLDLKKAIRKSLQQKANKAVSAQAIKKLSKSPSRIKTILKKIKPKKRLSAKAKRIKKAKQLKQRRQDALDLKQLEAQEITKIQNKLVDNLAKEFEKANPIKLTTTDRVILKNQIRKKLLSSKKATSKAPTDIRIVKKGKKFNDFVKSVKNKNKRLKKFISGKKAIKRRPEVVHLSLLEGQAEREIRNKIAKELLKKADDATGNVLTTLQKTDLKKNILKKLDSGIDPQKLKRLLQTKVKTPKGSKVTVKTSKGKKIQLEVKKKPVTKPKKRVKTAKDFGAKADDVGSVQIQGSQQQQLLQKTKVKSKVKQKTKTKQKQRQGQRQTQKLRLKKKSKLKTKQVQAAITTTRLALSGASQLKQESRQGQLQKTKQKTKTKQKQKQRQAVAQKFKPGVTQTTGQGTRQGVSQTQNIAQKIKQPTTTKQITIRGKEKVVRIRGKKKKRSRKKPSKKKQGYNVLGKPIKTAKGKKAKRMIRVNKNPLSKQKATDLRNYIADTSLSRSSKIKKTKGAPKQSTLKIPRGYSKRTSDKFRNYRIIKGKKVPLTKGKVIEKNRRLLDTKQERNKITLRKRIKQIQKPKKKAAKKRKPLKKIKSIPNKGKKR